MAKRVNPRPYRSTRRREQADQTRGAILDASERLFSSRGYVAATIEAIAEEAGVAVQTVYATFGSKRRILESLVQRRVRGEDATVPLMQHEAAVRIRDEQDPLVQARLVAGLAREVHGRVARIHTILRDAAAADPEIASEWKATKRRRLEDDALVVEWLLARGPLRDGMRPDTARDIVWALVSPDVYLLLVEDRGWSPGQYEDWLAETLATQLRPPV